MKSAFFMIRNEIYGQSRFLTSLFFTLLPIVCLLYKYVRLVIFYFYLKFYFI
jgi:hypothetical protein